MTDVQHTAADTPDTTRAAAVRPARSDWLIRWGAVLAVLGLAAIAAVVSYQHLYDVAIRFGEPPRTGWLFPLTIDGLIVVVSLVLLHCARAPLPVPAAIRAALWLGIGATLAANAVHGLANDWGGALVSATPALVLVIAYEILIWMIRAMREAAPAPAPDVVERIEYRDREVPVEVVREIRLMPRDRYDAARWTYEESLTPGARRVGRRSLATQWGITEVEARTIQEEVDAERDLTPDVEARDEAVEAA